MRKLDLTSYEIDGMVDDKDEKGEVIGRKLGKIPFGVKTSVINILFHPDLRLGAVELLERDELAKKIKDSEDTILLEEAEYVKIKKAVDTIRGYGQNDIEFVKRVTKAPQIEVEAKKVKEG